ncbi:uncharacterized protein LOC117915395 isoform X2 [Vitis riparia]|uniref:uncharacterized protein LOC117915395 isoform X2 n=1 Tax=Vitis riparia TaxID=96939 RepID=UPI00155AB830|nr:uncharacterized protein LOC117915395 isoform X2 [Vitis riparia]
MCLLKTRRALGSDSLHYTVDEGSNTKMVNVLKKVTMKTLGSGYEVGDMVWGKVKSHPWWPGQILDEGFAEPAARRTKREGHVLVSFYGDDSYGWFDPVELVPFDSHYAEKSKQTNADAFVSSVEEAVNEAARRAALGLVCNCCNPNSFLSSSVEGFFSVHVNGYEHQGLYSAEQIKRARDGFRPVEMHSFVLEIAMMPFSNAERSIDCIKNASTVLAYRKAVFKEIDEPYLQALGVPEHSGHLTKVLGQQEKVLSQGERNGSAGPINISDQQKKCYSLVKQIDESDVSEVNFSLEQQRSFLPSVSEEGVTALVDGDYVLQRSSPISVKSKYPGMQDRIVAVGSQSTIPSLGITGKEVIAVDKQPLLANDSSADAQVNMTEVVLPAEVYGFDLSRMSESYGLKFQRKAEVMDDYKLDAAESLDGSQSFQQPHSSLSETDENSLALDSLQLAGGLPPPYKVLVTSSIVLEGKSMIVNQSVMGKKKKKEFSTEAGLVYPLKRRKTVKTKALVTIFSEKSSLAGLGHSNDSQIDQQGKDNAVTTTISSDSGVAKPMAYLRNTEINLPQLLHDLLALACDLFHGSEQNTLANVQQFFLPLRSIICQKSSPQVHPTEVKSVEVRTTISPSTAMAAERLPCVNAMDQLYTSKPTPRKKQFKPEDHGEAGQNGSIAGSGEELSTKGFKRLSKLESLDVVKKSGHQKPLEVQGSNPQEMSTMVPTKPMNNRKLGARIRAAECIMDQKVLSMKVPKRINDLKLEAQVGTAEPTMLMMKFPPKTTLPSIPELKARFARFGPLDHSATRVFWSSSMCQVVFKHKRDAQAAYSFAMRNSSLFGNMKVDYHLKVIEASAPQLPESINLIVEKTANGVLNLNSVGAGKPTGCSLRPRAQLKSCLMSPLGAALASTTGVPIENPPVKFMLGGEKCATEEPVVASNRNINNSTNFNIKNFNFQQVFTPPMLPLISHSFQIPNVQEKSEVGPFDKAPNVRQYGQPDATNNVHTSTAHLIDFFHRMLNVLKRCEDIVGRIKSQGYNTYQPLR